MDKDRLLNIVNNIHPNDSRFNFFRESIFKEYINQELEVLNKKLIKTGLVDFPVVSYDLGAICFIDATVKRFIKFKSYKVIEMIKCFEAQKENIEKEAFNFVEKFHSDNLKAFEIVNLTIDNLRSQDFIVEPHKFKTAISESRNKTAIFVRIEYKKVRYSFSIDKCKLKDNLLKHELNLAITKIKKDLYQCWLGYYRRRMNGRFLKDKEKEILINQICEKEDFRMAYRISRDQNLPIPLREKIDSIVLIGKLSNVY